MIVKVLTSHWNSARNCLFGKDFQAIADTQCVPIMIGGVNGSS
jgi:hypothetical protein